MTRAAPAAARGVVVRGAPILLAVALAACSPPSPERIELTVFAAASLTDALAEIEPLYESENPDVDLVIATDSSAALRTQIEEGAPADVFLSADMENPQALADQDLTDSAPLPFVGNSLALVVPTANRAEVTTPVDVADPGVRIVAAGPEVPISGYAAEVVANLAALPGYPEGFADAYAANVVSEEDNVRAVLTKIELEEADAGFVYLTDALASPSVSTIDIPAEANTHAIYAGCVLAASPHVEAATAFFHWLRDGPGQAIFGGLGFVAP